ncbi:MAG: hypothetical protein RL226_1047 [Bacteroidota bacterium]|jgi:hypothetical protein
MDIRTKDASGEWTTSHALPNPESGIYLIHFHPLGSDIYEKRRLNTPNEHVIVDGECVVKTGKFTAGLIGRLTSISVGYTYHWKYRGELYPTASPRTYSPCFEEVATVYLLADLSAYSNDIVALVEMYIRTFIDATYSEELQRQEPGGRTEYRNCDNLETGIDNLVNECEQALNDFLNCPEVQRLAG